MPPKLTANDITACFAVTLKTLEVLADNLNTPFLGVISTTIQSLLDNIGAVKQNKDECTLLMEKTHNLLNAIIVAHMKSDTGGELPVNVLNHIGRFSETLHKIHTFVEAQQSSSKIKRFFRQGEMNTLLRDCKTELQQGLEFFQIKSVNVMKDIAELHEESQKRYQEVLNMIETLSDTSSDRASTIGGVYSRSHNSSNSISMLPSEPKIFHGRDSELSEILKLFHQTTPRIAILGAGGMGKTSLAQAAVHHPEIVARYHQFRFFVACDSASTKAELAALIGAHLELKPGKDLARMVVNHFSGSPPTLLILDNFETLWEPVESRKDIEEFLSLLTDVKHLALMITLRGAERPAKISWSRPFLPPLLPLEHDAALHTFLDITDYNGDQREIDQVLSLTGNMPLAINLLAHLADSEGCTHVLSRWELEKTTLISDGHDRRTNLDLSISLSLSSPRINAVPGAQELLSLLSILPDGLSDVELVQSKLPIVNIRSCKAALIGTALAYIDKQKRIKVLVPIREYVCSVLPPRDPLTRPLLIHFQELLELYNEFRGTHSNSGIVAQISSNYANIQNVAVTGIQEGHQDLTNSIYCFCYLHSFSVDTGREAVQAFLKIPQILPHTKNARLQAYFVAELLQSWEEYLVPNFQILIAEVLEHFKDFDDDDLKYSISMCHFIIGERNMNLSMHWSMLKMLSLWQLLPETRRDRLNHCEPSDG
ncbi:P-loop containing nucleoside triphosphate hydrolase protein [Mycena olivaceomarginata]|nr:P-loop containing nucleoside triphosphate hydrolase protein [Mycena olivaceomarginata]